MCVCVCVCVCARARLSRDKILRFKNTFNVIIIRYHSWLSSFQRCCFTATETVAYGLLVTGSPECHRPLLSVHSSSMRSNGLAASGAGVIKKEIYFI